MSLKEGLCTLPIILTKTPSLPSKRKRKPVTGGLQRRRTGTAAWWRPSSTITAGRLRVACRAGRWAPSPFEVNTGEVPKAMEEEDIREVVEGFADCAARLCGLGLDGVEINAGQNSLLRQFLSPLTNFRTDAYGGSLENRARFCREVLEAVRRAAGPGPIVGLRICGDEYAPWGGLKPEDSRDLVLHLCGGGLVDYVAVEVGSIYSLHLTAASMRYPEDYAVPPARLMAQSLTVPVCAAGSMVSLERPKLWPEGIQLVEMTRALIADPYLPVRSGCGRGGSGPVSFATRAALFTGR